MNGRHRSPRNYRPLFHQGEDQNRIKATVKNFQARSKLGAAKTAARVRNLAELLRQSRAEIGKPHPQEPGRIIVTLDDLQIKFYEIYALPPWGKKMAECDLHKELDKPEFSDILSFWKFREDGGIYVEEVSQRGSPIPVSAGPVPESVFKNSLTVSSFQPIVEPAKRNSLSSYRGVETNVLLEEDSGDGFFQSGPGFGKSIPPKNRTSQNGEFAEIAQRFGVVTESSHGRMNSTHRSAEETIMSSTITPTNPMKTLANYIQTHGPAPYESLPGEDKKMVNLSNHVFEVFTTMPADVFVRLKNPNIDTFELIFTGKDLRDPIEDDFSGMLIGHFPRGLRLVVPVLFVPPRGFLIISPDYSDVKESNMRNMESILKEQMSSNCRELNDGNVRPGMPAVYIYYEESHARYCRVMIIGKCNANDEDDVIVVLADSDKQLFVDAKLCELFMLPDESGFEIFPPHLCFATLSGVEGLSEREQSVMRKNIDDDERNKKVYAYFSSENGRIPTVDMIFRNEGIEWLSQIAKKRGASMIRNQKCAHLQKSARSCLPDSSEENVLDFIDCTGADEVDSEGQKVFEPILPSHRAPSPSAIVPNLFSIASMDLRAAFDLLVDKNDMVSVFGMVQFARSVLPNLVSREESEQLVEYMRHVADQRFKLKL